MNELEHLLRLSKGLWWATVFCPVVGALLAIVANGYRQWRVEPRISALRLAAQNERAAAAEKAHAERQAALREEVARAEQRVTAAEGRAARAEASALAARQRADRHLPVPVSQTLHEAVLESLSQWSSSHGGQVDVLWSGRGTPAMDQVSRDLLALLQAARVPVGNTAAIGLASGVPHGALLFCEPDGHAAGEALVRALRPLIPNIQLQARPESRLTLHLNGTPAFEPSGAFSIE